MELDEKGPISRGNLEEDLKEVAGANHTDVQEMTILGRENRGTGPESRVSCLFQGILGSLCGCSRYTRYKVNGPEL